MPLPDDPEMTWPPAACTAMQDYYEQWNAWYCGDTVALASVYGDITSTVITRNQVARQFFQANRPRFRATMRRWFWGQPVSVGEQMSKLHLPIAGDIAGISADLLFAEPPTISVTGDDAATAQLQKYTEDGLWAGFRESAEIGAAMGGVYQRIAWDGEVRERPWLTACSPEHAVPEWRWGQLSAVTFHWIIDGEPGDSVDSSRAHDTREVVRYLERHEPGAILRGVYIGTRTKLGRRGDLASYPQTVALAETGDIQETGTTRLTAAYIPNMRPNRIWNGHPDAVNLGRSDYSGIELMFDAIDEAWSSWIRDLRLGKAQLIVPQSALVSLGKGKGAVADYDRELVMALNLGPTPDGKLDQVQFDIRFEAHRETLKYATETAVRDAGYSMQTLSGSGDTAMTATEVNSRERRSMLTRGRKIQYHHPVIRDLIETLLDVDTAQFGPDGVTPADVAVEWPKTVFTDPMDTASTLQLLRDARVVSQPTAIGLLHPDWDDEQIQQEVARINAEDEAADGLTFPAA